MKFTENIVESSDSLRNSLSQLEQFEKEAVDAVDKISMLELSIEKTERRLVDFGCMFKFGFI